MELIKDTIKNLLEDWQRTPKTLFLEGVLVRLKRILTRKELRHIKLEGLYQGVVYLKVDSAVWLYHFNLCKEDLLNKLKENLPIKDIRFYIGDKDEKETAEEINKKG